DYIVRFAANDGLLTTTQSVLLHVALEPTPPTATIVLTPSFPVTPGTVVTVHALASSIAPITSVVLTLDGQPVPLDATGTGHITAGQPGKKTLTAVATDQDGITGTTTLAFKVRDPNDLTPPVVALDPKLGQVAVASLANVLGTVADTNLDFWTLELAPLGS